MIFLFLLCFPTEAEDWNVTEKENKLCKYCSQFCSFCYFELNLEARIKLEGLVSYNYAAASEVSIVTIHHMTLSELWIIDYTYLDHGF